MSALVRAFSNFSQAISNIAFAILNAFLAVFQAVVQLARELVTGVLDIIQAVVHLFTELVQDTVGFVFANFFLILFVGGAYYLYTNYSGSARSKGKRQA